MQLDAGLVGTAPDGQAPPRVKVVPAQPPYNSAELVVDMAEIVGMSLDQWQQEVLYAAMGEHSTGTWVARRVGLSAPRQNGKTEIIVARVLAGALFFGEKKIIVSAHQQETARVAFERINDLVDHSVHLRQQIRQVMNSFNRESIKFHNGAQITFKTRVGATGRGLSADCLIMDEAQIISPRLWVGINSAMSARENPQVWLVGTPPTPFDEGETFGAVRDSAIRGTAGDIAYLEWSADRQDPPNHAHTLWKANPAWNVRINHGVVADEYTSYPKDDYARERLGRWDEVNTGTRVFKKTVWDALATPRPDTTNTRVAYAVKFSSDNSGVALAAAYRWDDDRPVYVQPIKQANLGQGQAWLVDYLADRADEAAQIVIDGRQGVGFLVNALREAGIRNKHLILVPTLMQVKDAHSMFEGSVTEGTVSHPGHEEFDKQALDAGKRSLDRQGGFGWKPTEGSTVIALEAATLAFWAVKTTKRDPRRKGLVI